MHAPGASVGCLVFQDLPMGCAELLACLRLAALQVHGGAGVCDDLPLARMWSGARTLRLADGPDDVHLVSIAKLELAKLSKL